MTRMLSNIVNLENASLVLKLQDVRNVISLFKILLTMEWKKSIGCVMV